MVLGETEEAVASVINPPGSVKTQAIHDSGIASSSLKNSPTLPDPLFFWYLAVVPSEGPLVTDGKVLPEIYR